MSDSQPSPIGAPEAFEALERELAAMARRLAQADLDRQRDEQALRAALRETAAIMVNAPVAIYFTRERRLVRYNRRCAEMFAIDGDAGVGMPARRFYRNDEEYEALSREAEPLLSNGQPFQAELYLRRLDGRDMWVRLIAYIQDAENTAHGTIWICEDRTEARRTLDALHHTLREREAIMQNAPVGLLFTREQRIVRYNPKWAAMFAFGERDHTGLHARVHFRSDEEYEALGRAAAPLLGAGLPFQTELYLRREDGSEFWGNVLAYVLDARNTAEGTIWICEDRTLFKQAEQRVQRLNAELEQRVAERTAALLQANASLRQEMAERERAEYAAQHDALTGLPNRVLLEHDLVLAIAHARRQRAQLALLFIDLDGFKPVNDSLGHEAGDQLLRTVATRLRAVVREEDPVARLGGDEFVVVLSAVHAGDAERVADKLLRSLAEPVALGPHEARIGASIGIALYPDDGTDAPALLRAADAAMYRAKLGGRQRWARHGGPPARA